MYDSAVSLLFWVLIVSNPFHNVSIASLDSLFQGGWNFQKALDRIRMCVKFLSINFRPLTPTCIPTYDVS